MRSGIMTLIALSLICGAKAAPTYSCFDPPDEGQTNPLGEGLEDVVEDECCEALVDDGDIAAERLVVWDPVNCNHGPGEDPITEEPLCRAHDTDGCRFCRETCEGFEGLCLVCADIVGSAVTTDSPTSSPFETTGSTGSAAEETPAPVVAIPTTPAPVAATPAPVAVTVTPAPVIEAAPETPAPVTEAAPETPAPVIEAAPETPAPVTEAAPETPAPVIEAAPETPAPVIEAAPETPAPVTVTPAPITEAAPETPAPVMTTPAPVGTVEVTGTPAPTEDPSASGTGDGAGGVEGDCDCMGEMSAAEMEVLETRGKFMVCDPSCSDGSDLVWGVMNCNYFALGQDCRACSDICDEGSDGAWLDQDEAFCKPCSAIP